MQNREVPSQGMELTEIAVALQDLVKVFTASDPIAHQLGLVIEKLGSIDEKLGALVTKVDLSSLSGRI